jgi:DNA-binding XRE family transcriptional regulator
LPGRNTASLRARSCPYARLVPNPNVALSVPPRILDGDFAGWLREAMAGRRMSQRMLAMRAGVSHATISRLLKGHREPSLSTALALMSALERPDLRVAPDRIEDDPPGEAAS